MLHVKSLALFPIIIVGCFIVPVFAGLVGTCLPAFGYLPVIGENNFNLNAIEGFFSYPGVATAFKVTVLSSLVSSTLALVFSFGLVVYLYESRLWSLLKTSLSPLLAFPHAAFAIGISLLLAPSGLYWRLFLLISPSENSPNDILLWGDNYGFSLAVVLALKEIPFLLLIMVAVLPQLKVDKVLWLGKSMGYSSTKVWFKFLFPQLWTHLKLPFFAVLAYSLSVVDVAQIAGPSLPPSLAVLVNSLFYHADLDHRLFGAVGAMALGLLAIIYILSLVLIEKIWRRVSASLLINGERGNSSFMAAFAGKISASMILWAYALAFVVLFVQSIAFRWPFPGLLPSSWSLNYWFKSLAGVGEVLGQSLFLGLLSSLISLVLVVGCLECQQNIDNKKSIVNNYLYLIYIPLIVPQISFLFGLQTILISLSLDGRYGALVFSHLIFVLPYVYLTLAKPYFNYDDRFSRATLSLGKSKIYAFLRIKLPILLKPIIFSFAIGFSVSIVQYLPTIYAGAGRFVTITTETVALASGSDKRIAAVHAILQLLLPVLVFCLALFIPKFLFRNRLAMKS
ncbi:MAG: hypothetical protein OCC45_01270 [Desulfotalea sp.]